MTSPSNGSLPPEIALPSLAQIVAGNHEGADWFIEGILPQGCFLIVGRPKIGKSWLNLQLAITLAVGGTFLGHECLGVFDVLYVAAEDDAGRIASRFSQYRVREAPTNLAFMCRNDLAKYAATHSEHYTFAEFLESYLLSRPKVKAVFIDTESTVRSVWDAGRGPGDIEASVTRKDYAEVREFDELAHRRRVFIGLVNHTSKRKSSFWIDIHELINRTNTASAGASGSWVLADPPGSDQLEGKSDACKVLGIRGRDISKDLLLSVRQDELATFQSLGPFNEHRQTEAEKEVLEVLEELTKEGAADAWYTAKDISAELGKSFKAIQMTIGRMKRAGRSTWKTYYVETKKKKGMRLMERGTPITHETPF